jgi:hypothetical protein
LDDHGQGIESTRARRIAGAATTLMVEEFA